MLFVKQHTELQDFTHKTVFHTALASSRQCSKIHSFSVDLRDIKFQRTSDITLEVVIPQRSSIDIVHLNGPVRALRFYLDRTRDLRQGKQRLFISYMPGFTRDVTTNTVPRWISKHYCHPQEVNCNLVSTRGPQG